jgi:hypothetical protein
VARGNLAATGNYNSRDDDLTGNEYRLRFRIALPTLRLNGDIDIDIDIVR